MCSDRCTRLRHAHLPLHLSAWYSGIFALASVLAYLLAGIVLQEHTDDTMRKAAHSLTACMETGGLERVKTAMTLATQGETASHVFFRLWSSQGHPLAATELAAWPALAAPRASLLRLTPTASPVLETLPTAHAGHDVRSLYMAIAPGLVLQMGHSLREYDKRLAILRHALLILFGTAAALSALIGWFLTRALPPQPTRHPPLLSDLYATLDGLMHDLRGPLTRLRAAAELALPHPNSCTDCQAMARHTLEECNRLLAMINATLDIAEAQSGTARLKRMDVDLVALVNDACELFQTVAEDRQVTLSTELPPTCRIAGDRQRLQRVVANLLDNALKYTPPGGRVHIRLVAAGQWVRLSIEDNGSGIPPKALPHIFERFYRCDPSRAEDGNGLGLSLALAFVRAHGGDITVRSAPGRGSTFTISLKRAPGNP